MEDGATNAAQTFPANGHELIVIANGKARSQFLHLEIWTGYIAPKILDISAAITIYLIHVTRRFEHRDNPEFYGLELAKMNYRPWLLQQ